MATDEMILDSDRFVMLDLVNTINQNETTRDYPIVQIVDSSNKYSFQNVEAIKNRIENTIKFEEKEKICLQSLLILMRIITINCSGKY